MLGFEIRRSCCMISFETFRFFRLDTFSRKFSFFWNNASKRVANSLVTMGIPLFFMVLFSATASFELYAGNDLSLSLSVTNVTCTGQTNGTISSTVTGSSGGTITYTLLPGSVTNTTGFFNNLGPGIYTISADDAGTTMVLTATITEPIASPGVVVTSNTPVCNNSAILLSATPSGGTAPYTFSWSGPNSFNSNIQSPVIVNPALAAAGSYHVTITDANGCNASSSAAISISTAPTVTATASVHSICAGGAVTLSSSSNIPAAPSLPPLVFTTANFSTDGTTSLAEWTVRNDGYSTNGMTFHSNNNSSFYLSDSRAQNGTITDTRLVSQSYNTMGYSNLALSFWHYFRYNSAINESAKVQVSTNGTSWTTVASYTATVGTSASFVNQNINLNAYIDKPQLFVRFIYYSESRARYWAIDNVSLSGTSTTGLPVISWSSSPTGFSSTLASPPTVNPNETTTYTVMYTDPSTGCSNIASETITVNPTPVVAIQPNYCAVPGHVRLTASGGTSYTWSTGETTNPILTDIADTYGVTTTNAFGCTGSAFLPVSTELVINGDFSAGNTGFTNAYGYTSAANGLFPEGLYSVGADPTFFHSNFWGRDHTSNSGNFLIVNGIGSAGVVVWQETVPILPNTEYYFSAWAISLNNVAPYANLQFNVNGTLVGTTAPLAARATNNNPPYNWQRFYGNWNSGTATSAVIQIVDLQTALGGNDFGLDDVSFGTLAPIPFTIAPTVNPTATACSGKTMYLKANITGGRSPVTYSWSGPNGFVSALKDPVIPNVTVAHSGVYTLSVVDGYGCDPVTGSATAVVLQSPTPQISSIGGLDTVCPGTQEKYWTSSLVDISNGWSVTGGTIIGSATKDTIAVQWAASGNGLITLTSVNTVNGCDSTVSKAVLIQDLVAPVITCPTTQNISGCDETSLNTIPFAVSESTITLAQLILAGGNASDNCALQSITYQDTKSGTNPLVVNRTYNAIDYAGNKSSCTQIINISDSALPTLTAPADFNFCVDDLYSASIVSSLLQINPAPDHFLFKKGNGALDINPTSFADNCTSVNQLVLHWKIDFSPSIPTPSITGTGQPSAHTGDILFPGDGNTFLDVIHTITYWLTDQNGNESVHQAVAITIHPRPALSQYFRPFLNDYIDTNPKFLCHENNNTQKRFD